MATIGRIEPFDASVDKWPTYFERIQLYFKANNVKEAAQVATLLTLIGGPTYTLLRSLVAPDNPADKNLAEINAVLEAHLSPKPLLIVERFRFHRRQQNDGETIAQFIAALRTLAIHCDFGATLNDTLRDRFVCGLRSQAIQRKLLSESNLTLQKAVEIALSTEAASRDASEMSSGVHVGSSRPAPSQTTSASVDRVPADTRSRSRGPHKHPSRPSGPGASGHTSSHSRPGECCYRCGDKRHFAPDCPHKDKTCHSCGKRGHLSSACRSKDAAQSKQRSSKVVKHVEQPVSFSQAESADASSPLNGYGLFNLGSGSSQQVGKTAAPLMLPLTLNGTQVEMELDTGAAVSLMTKQQWDRLPTRSVLAPSTVTLRTYTGEHVHVHGEATVRVGYAGQEHTLSLVVVDGKGPALFGRNWLQTIKLNWAEIKSLATEARNTDLTARFPEVFAEGLGTMSTTAKLQVSHDAQPKFFKPRPVPYALRPAVSDELDRLEAAGILEQVPFSDWATPIVCVRKSNGSVRLCGDYKVTINPALSVDQHPLPRPEELLHSLAGGTVFSVLDMTNAYQQMKLAEDSRVFTTINTDRGLYRYTRLPFGIASAPAIFQRAMDQITQGLRGVVVYIDDILVTGRTQAEHDNNLNALMQRLRENGVRLRREKCKLNKSSVEYLGFRIDADGVHVATSKVAAVLQAPMPKDASQLRSFLGLINYHARFIKNLSTMLHPLYVLLKHDTPWKWSEHCQKAFDAAKNALASPDVLAHYDPKLPVRLATDASPYGVGAVLMHVTPDGLERPVAFASRALNRSEQNYSQLDREALGIIFGVKKFHTYLFGRRFTLITDHKPLTSIFSPTKGTPLMAAARLQRWSIVLASYDYDIEYRSSANNASADATSRLPLAQEDADSFVTEEEIFHTPVESTLPVTAIQLGTATQHDPILAQVHRWTRSGWPSTLPNEMFQPYKVRQHELSTDGACLLWGARVVVPAVLRADVLQMLHEQHPGMCRMKAIARSHVWWPSMNTAIEEQVRSCSPRHTRPATQFARPTCSSPCTVHRGTACPRT